MYIDNQIVFMLYIDYSWQLQTQLINVHPLLCLFFSPPPFFPLLPTVTPLSLLANVCVVFSSLFLIAFSPSLTHPVSYCSCRGRGQLWRSLSQSKDSDRGAIRALHLDPHSGEAVMLHPPNHPSLTATNRHHPSPSQPSQPRLPVCPPAKSVLRQSQRMTQRDECILRQTQEVSQRGKEQYQKRDSETDVNTVMCN